ncbi:hypothetical protein BDF20DRAFT_909613 [Mycotypha africana]|uniref:uncharacterized protein n=1 Tax=Mycotypha africana TaxID=64632 RepID=UPI0023018294|nr:uncharacterized protein BDF20DRAFT_909613 [Mycotypha africana]KAI8991903.1 hypothetical protein BDF20DRAFT_909613 [Mycotypha africana]
MDSTPAIDIPNSKSRPKQIVVSARTNGNTLSSSLISDSLDHQRNTEAESNSLPNYTESGISPTYYSSSGIPIRTSHQTNDATLAGSPVFNDRSRIFFKHSAACSCRGSGVGCDCSKTCSC